MVFLLTIIALSTFECLYAKVGFMKDQSMDAIFPPRIIRSETGIPDGHLRPLGWQKKPESKVTEESNVNLSPTEFYIQYVSSSTPVVFRAAVKDVPAMTLWDEEDKFLNKNYGKLDVSVTVKREVLRGGPPEKMKFSKFLREYKYENWYLSTSVPQEMMKDLPVPNCLSCGTPIRFFQEAELWMSSGGTASLLHYHADHNFHCVLAGRKDFIFIKNSYKKHFDVVEKSIHDGSGYSKIDMDMINVFKYPDISKVPWSYASLRAGDCALVPAGYMHQVRSYGRSISSVILWAPTPEFSDEDCHAKGGKLKTLSDATFTWVYSKGSRQLFNARLNSESMRHYLLALLRNDDQLYFERFSLFYDEVTSESDNYLPASTVFAYLNSADESFITREEIMKLKAENLARVAQELNKARPGHRHDEL